MWVNKKQHEREIDLLHRTIRDLQLRLDGLKKTVETLYDENNKYRAVTGMERVSAAAAKAYYDTARVQNNELKLERAALLARLLPGLQLSVPTVQTGVVEPPGASLEDMGDAAASVFGDANIIPEDPERMPRAADEIKGAQVFMDPDEHEEPGGLSGTVVRSAPGV